MLRQIGGLTHVFQNQCRINHKCEGNLQAQKSCILVSDKITDTNASCKDNVPGLRYTGNDQDQQTLLPSLQPWRKGNIVRHWFKRLVTMSPIFEISRNYLLCTVEFHPETSILFSLFSSGSCTCNMGIKLYKFVGSIGKCCTRQG